MYYKTVAVRLAYGSMSLFIAILHNVFLLYYVDIFVSVYKIDRNSFWLGEVGAFVLSQVTCFLLKIYIFIVLGKSDREHLTRLDSRCRRLLHVNYVIHSS